MDQYLPSEKFSKNKGCYHRPGRLAPVRNGVIYGHYKEDSLLKSWSQNEGEEKLFGSKFVHNWPICFVIHAMSFIFALQCALESWSRGSLTTKTTASDDNKDDSSVTLAGCSTFSRAAKKVYTPCPGIRSDITGQAKVGEFSRKHQFIPGPICIYILQARPFMQIDFIKIPFHCYSFVENRFQQIDA